MSHLFRFREIARGNLLLVSTHVNQQLASIRQSIHGNSLLSDFCVGPSLPTQSCPDRPRADAIGSYSFGSPFKRHTARQTEQASLAGAICCVLIESNVGRLACNVDDASGRRLDGRITTAVGMLRSKECSRKRLACECRSVEIHHVMLQAVLRRCLFEWTQRNIASGVDEHRWESCVILGDCFERVCNRRRIGHVACVCSDAVVASAQRSVHAIESGLDFVGLKRRIQKSKFRTLRSQKSSNGRTNATYRISSW